MHHREMAFAFCVMAAFNVHAQCQFGPEQCKSGFVWREAYPGDHVCVTGATRSQVASDNSQATVRRQASSDFCVPGFVWREASPSDRVCVTGSVRAATWSDNAAAAGRRDPQCAGLSTVMGNIQFSEAAGTLTPRPAAGAEIELWFCGNWLGTLCGWNKLAGGKTDDAGNYSWTITGPRDPRDQYQVRVYARNSAAIVWQSDTASNFWSDVAPQAIAATPGNPVLNLSRVFGNTGSDLFVSRHLNAAQKLLAAREFVLRFRDASEADTLGRVIVGPSIATGTAFTNSGVIRVNPDDMFDEVTLVHEYGHFAQESIGAYYLWPSVHDGCFIGSPSAPGNTREFAWFEGFPAFFSKAVRLVSAARYGTKEAPQTLSSYTPMPCAAIGRPGPGGALIVPEAVEQRVTDFLFLLLNDSGPAPTCGAASSSPAYRQCATPVWERNARLIMSIFDRELDFSQPDPVNVTTFARAWLARGGDRAHLDAAMTAVGMTPLPVTPPQPPVSPHAACIQGCNQQLSGCMADAHSGPERGACAREGRACKARCPP